MKIIKTGTIDEIRDSIKKDGQEKPLDRGELRRELNYDEAKHIAQARFEIIAPAVSGEYPDSSASAYFARISKQEHEWPTGDRRTFSDRTMRQWLSAYKSRGFEGLMPKRQAPEQYRENDAQGSRKRFDDIYSDIPKSDMTSEEIDFFNASMGDISSSHASGDRILGSIKRYIEARGYRYDTRNRFDGMTHDDHVWPFETFYYTKGDTALALSVTGPDCNRGYSHFCMKKCDTYNINDPSNHSSLKHRPPRPKAIHYLSNNKGTFREDSHVADRRLISTPDWTQEGYSRPWWEFGDSKAKEIFRSVAPSARKEFESLGYDCNLNYEKSRIEFRTSPDYFDYMEDYYDPEDYDYITFDLDSRRIGFDFAPEDESHLSTEELEAVKDRFICMGWSRSHSSDHSQSARDMIASQGFDLEEHKTSDGRIYELDFSKSRQGKKFDGRAYPSEYDHIVFDLDSQTVKLTEGDWWPVLSLNADEFAAVWKQVEELGWNKEKAVSRENGSRSKSRSEDDYEMDI